MDCHQLSGKKCKLQSKSTKKTLNNSRSRATHYLLYMQPSLRSAASHYPVWVCWGMSSASWLADGIIFVDKTQPAAQGFCSAWSPRLCYKSSSSANDWVCNFLGLIPHFSCVYLHGVSLHLTLMATRAACECVCVRASFGRLYAFTAYRVINPGSCPVLSLYHTAEYPLTQLSCVLDLLHLQLN